MKFMNHILGLIVNWPTLGLLEQSKHVRASPWPWSVSAN